MSEPESEGKPKGRLEEHGESNSEKHRVSKQLRLRSTKLKKTWCFFFFGRLLGGFLRLLLLPGAPVTG
jgi:hypothetical protein